MGISSSMQLALVREHTPKAGQAICNIRMVRTQLNLANSECAPVRFSGSGEFAKLPKYAAKVVDVLGHFEVVRAK